MSEQSNKIPNLVFIFPFNYSPEKFYYQRFCLKSKWSKGYIFTRSDTTVNNLVIDNYTLYSIKTSPTNTINASNFIKMLSLIFKTLKNKSPIDAVIVYDPLFSGLCGCILKFWFKTKLILEVNGEHEFLMSDPRPFNQFVKKFVAKITLKYADILKVSNESERNYFSEVYPKKPIYKFIDFVECSRFLNLNPSQGNYLLSIGFPFKLKGMDLIINAFNKITHKHPNISLKIIGHCPENELLYYKSLAKNNKNIQLLKPGDVRTLLKDCYAYISASHSEAGSRAVIEAMSCKKPIISTTTKGGIEYVHDQKNGLLCNKNDIDDLANKIDMLLGNPDWANQLGMKGYNMVLNEHNEDKYNIKYNELIRDILYNSNEGSGK